MRVVPRSSRPAAAHEAHIADAERDQDLCARAVLARVNRPGWWHATVGDNWRDAAAAASEGKLCDCAAVRLLLGVESKPGPTPTAQGGRAAAPRCHPEAVTRNVLRGKPSFVLASSVSAPASCSA